MLGLSVSSKFLRRYEDLDLNFSQRKAKRRCIVVAKDAPCQRCGPLHIRCSLVYHDEPYPLNGASVSRSTFVEEPGNILPPIAVCSELVDLYFEIMHDKQHTLFHRPTFITEQSQGRAPLVLVYAMMALVAR